MEIHQHEITAGHIDSIQSKKAQNNLKFQKPDKDIYAGGQVYV